MAAMCAGDALTRSLYAPQLERIFEHYPREQVLVLQYERCVADTAAQLRRTYAFIGADPHGHQPTAALVRRRGPSPHRYTLASETESEVSRAIHKEIPVE